MKKFILLALIGFSAWNYYSKNESATHSSAGVAEVRVEAPFQQSQPNFTCDGRQHCSQMTTRAEAEFFVIYCPNTKMDGDRDGIPCENDSRF